MTQITNSDFLKLRNQLLSVELKSLLVGYYTNQKSGQEVIDYLLKTYSCDDYSEGFSNWLNNSSLVLNEFKFTYCACTSSGSFLYGLFNIDSEYFHENEFFDQYYEEFNNRTRAICGEVANYFKKLQNS